jgi:hypothetical protein
MAEHETDEETPQSPIPASLELLIKGRSDEERVPILDAYYSFAKGDPKSFPVGFVVLLEAHASCMLRLPDDLKASMTAAINESMAALRAYQESIEKCCKTLKNDVALSAGHVATIHMMGSNLGAKMDMDQKHATEERKTHVEAIHAQFSKLTALIKLHMEELRKARDRSPWIGWAAGVVLGFGLCWLTRHFGL